MKGDVQALVNEVKSMSDAINVLREVGPRGEEVAIWASGRIHVTRKKSL
jgi:hypothetical protein